MKHQRRIIDGNQATAQIAYKLSDVIAISPITPATPIGERADAWLVGARAKCVGRLGQIVVDLQHWKETREYESIRQMQGSMSQRAVAEPAAFERAHYLKTLNTCDHRIV